MSVKGRPDGWVEGEVGTALAEKDARIAELEEELRTVRESMAEILQTNLRNVGLERERDELRAELAGINADLDSAETQGDGGK